MSETPQTMYRQGDILVLEITNIPSESVKSESNIILQSSANGNPHTLKNGIYYKRKIVDQWDRNNQVIGFIDSNGDKKVSLVHEEHKSITLPPGYYEVRRQREGKGFVVD